MVLKFLIFNNMVENLYLVFIKNIGISLEGKYKYEFYFSERPEVVWGDYWNVCPASVIPDIKPDINSINRIYELELYDKLNLVTENSCFSMQDCIDNIICLGWFDIDSEYYLPNENTVIKFRFGDHAENVYELLSYIGVILDGNSLIYEKTDDSEEMIDNLIDKLGGENDGLEW